MGAMTDPAGNAATITLSDSTVYTNIRALYVGVTGDVKVTCMGGTAAVFKAVPAGAIIPVRAKIIWSTGTTATDIVALS